MMGITRKEWGMVLVLLCGSLLVVMTANFLTPALPSIMEDMEISSSTVQWLTSGYSLVEGVVVPMSAFLLGKFKVRRLYFTGITVFACGSIVAFFAPTFPILLFGRMCQACAAGIVMPMVITLIMLIFPIENRGSAMGMVTLVISFAPAIGPSVGGVIVDAIGWRALFVLIFALAVILLLFAIKFVQNFEGFEKYALDIPSVILMGIGMVSLLYGISSITSTAYVMVDVVLIIVGAILLTIFFRRQLKLEQPMLRVEVLKSRRFRVNVFTIMFMQAALYGCGVIMPLYVQNVLGYSATITGIVMLPGAIIGAVVGMIAGRLFDKMGVRKLAVFGVTITLAAGVGLACYQIDSPLWFVIFVYAVIPIGMNMLTPVLNTWGINSLDNSVIQHANSLSNSLNPIAGSIGTTFLVALSGLSTMVAPNAPELQQLYMGDHIAFIGAMALIACGALVVYFGARNKKGDVLPASAANTVDAAPAGDLQED